MTPRKRAFHRSILYVSMIEDFVLKSGMLLRESGSRFDCYNSILWSRHILIYIWAGQSEFGWRNLSAIYLLFSLQLSEEDIAEDGHSSHATLQELKVNTLTGNTVSCNDLLSVQHMIFTGLIFLASRSGRRFKETSFSTLVKRLTLGSACNTYFCTCPDTCSYVWS